MKTRTIEADVLAVLSAATVTGSVVTLPGVQLERKLYERVNAVLVDLGGKWKTRVGHVFPDDPTERLDAAILTGSVDCRVDHLKAVGYFPTPAPLVARLLELAEVSGDMTALEPSAGRGAIADRLKTVAACVHVVELLDAHRAELSAKGHDVMSEADFLAWEPTTLYDRVVMNPPFAKQADIAHVTKAYGHLKPGGRLVAIMSAGVVFRQDAKALRFRELLERTGWHEVNPDDSFKESGTGVNTVTVVLDRAA